jgi:mRNA-degrading endonuclease toxin of MazEF toxin-antitoxin module
MNRGEIWLAHVGRKDRPVLVLTRDEVIDVRLMITVAEVTTSVRGIAAEIEFDFTGAGLSERSVINGDGLHTITRASLTDFVGAVESETLSNVCRAISYALGC